MATLFIYDSSIQDVIAAETDIPCVGAADAAWTDTGFVAAIGEMRRMGLRLKSCFCPAERRIYPPFSACYAGLAGDFVLAEPCGDPISRLNELRRKCVKEGIFTYVEPNYMNPYRIHGELSAYPRCAPSLPYPALFPGNIGPHVFLLQKLLNIRGIPCLVSGRFTSDTMAAVGELCCMGGLAPCGFVGEKIWRLLVLGEGHSCVWGRVGVYYNDKP